MAAKGSVLVTGGAGYIGSHACVVLLDQGYQVVVLDNLGNSSREALLRVQRISGCDLPFVEGDIRDRTCLNDIFSNYDFDAVMHFAGLKAVGESCEQPLLYYENNVAGTLYLCQAMAAAGVGTIIFSSSATVYGEPATVPIDEGFPLQPTNPYGQSKKMVEDIFRDLAAADGFVDQAFWRVGLLRYFNPVGAHPSGLIGESPNGIPNNLLPYMLQVAVGRREKLSVYGDDYSTPDGTGVRDYIHVMDLVDGHVRALDWLLNAPDSTGCHTWNLGTGTGYSVLEMIDALEKAVGATIPYQVVDRRPGDIPQCWANAGKAAAQIDWHARRGLDEMMAHSWNWQQKNPRGYD